MCILQSNCHKHHTKGGQDTRGVHNTTRSDLLLAAHTSWGLSVFFPLPVCMCGFGFFFLKLPAWVDDSSETCKDNITTVTAVKSSVHGMRVKLQEVISSLFSPGRSRSFSPSWLPCFLHKGLEGLKWNRRYRQ